jgi:transposase
MRGSEEKQDGMFSYISAEKRVPAEHPLRRVREMVDAALEEMSAELERMYSRNGRPSIAPERLLRALLLQCFYSVRSERLLMEQLDYNLLFRWFVGLRMDDEIWDVTVFTKNRERLLEGEVAGKFFERVLEQARAKQLLSDEHFTVDGTLIEAWANRRSFHEKKDPPSRGSGQHGKKLLRDTHESKTDPESRLYKKSRAGEARPSYLGHLVIENRNGLIVKPCVTQSGKYEEREAALAMLRRIVPEIQARHNEKREITVGADKAYQEPRFVEGLRELGVIPHVAEYERPFSGASANWLTVEEREHPGFPVSREKRKLVEKAFAWIKFVAGLRKTKFRGRRRVDWSFQLAAAAMNLIRLSKLAAATA